MSFDNPHQMGVIDHLLFIVVCFYYCFFFNYYLFF